MSQPRYQVISRIDAGGMAEVFKANSTSMQGFQKLVAIKRVLPSLTRNERFVRMWRYYLAASEMAFRHGRQCVFQVQLARDKQAVPLTRDYMA